MRNYDLALVGFGNVGKALAQLLCEKEQELFQKYQIRYKIIGISTKNHGIAIDPDGLDTKVAQHVVESNQGLNIINKLGAIKDTYNFIRQCNADVLFENSPVNYLSGQPAVDYLKLALKCNMHIITANKGPVVHAYQQLSELADSRNKKFLFESTVMDGAPIFSLFRDALPAINVIGFKGILNSTTNLILDLMEKGKEFNEAVSIAQELGIAETDPSGDIDGWDAAIKVAILVSVLMNKHRLPAEINRTGIRNISADDVVSARNSGLRWKLICTARLENNQLITKIAPEMVDPDSVFYSVEDTSSLVEFETDVLNKLTIIEHNPSPKTTAYGLLADFIRTIQ